MPIEPDDLDRLTVGYGNAAGSLGGLPPLCHGCGYNLTGAVSWVCPECGRSIERKKIRQQTADFRALVASVRHMNEWALLGSRIAAVGMFLALVSLVARKANGNSLAAQMMHLLSFACATISPMFAAGVIRVYRVPAWARLEYNLSPRWSIVWITLALAAGQFILDLL